MCGFELTEEFKEMLEEVEPIEAWRTSLTSDVNNIHKFSDRNCRLLALDEAPDGEYATHRQWQDKGRKIRKGEHGYRILANVGTRTRKETKVNADGEQETITKEIPKFKNVIVFHINQTEVTKSEQE